MGIAIQVPPWENVGTLPPVGMRDFQPGTFAKAKHHDALMDRNYKDHLTFKEALEKYGMARLFLFDDLKTLTETATGRPPGFGVIGPWPVWTFGPSEPASGEVEEVYAQMRLAGASGIVKIQWTTPDNTGQDVVWGIGLQALPVGGNVEAGESVATQVATATAQAFVRNETEFAFGPVSGADQFISLRIFRDAEAASDSHIYVGLLGVEIVIA